MINRYKNKNTGVHSEDNAESTDFKGVFRHKELSEDQ